MDRRFESPQKELKEAFYMAKLPVKRGQDDTPNEDELNMKLSTLNLAFVVK